MAAISLWARNVFNCCQQCEALMRPIRSSNRAFPLDCQIGKLKQFQPVILLDHKFILPEHLQPIEDVP